MNTLPLSADDDLPDGTLEAGPGELRPARSAAGLTLGLGLLLGVAGERLVTAVGGLGFTLWLALLGLAALALLRRVAPALLWPLSGWVGVALAAALVMNWRDSPAALLPMLLVLALAAALALLRAGGTGLRDCGVPAVLLSGAGLPLRAAGGILPLLGTAPRPAPGRLRALAGWGRGALLALPPLFVFTALFAAADRRFDSGLQALANLAPALPRHLVPALALGWACTGLLGGLLPGAPWRPRSFGPVRPRLGREETLAALGALCLLFLLFVGLQLGYLFGGPDYIAQVPELTVAEHARRGFFELLAVALLSLGLLLLGQPLAEPRAFRLLGRVLAGCVLILLASALQRLWLYVNAFGLTLARVAALAVLTWVALSLSLFLATVLRGRPQGFAGGAALVALLAAFALALANPAALVARVNLDRLVAGSADAADLDHLLQLGADAVPPLLAALPRLPAEQRCSAAGRLLDEWGPNSAHRLRGRGWRDWHAARTRAFAGIDARLPELIVQEAPCLPAGTRRAADGSLRMEADASASSPSPR